MEYFSSYLCLQFFVQESFFKNKFIYFIFAVLGLCCCVRAFSSCGKRGLFFVAVRGLLTAVASLVGSMGSRRMVFSSCGTQPSVVVAHGF